MLFKGKKAKATTTYGTVIYEDVLFKDKETINQRNLEEYLSNIRALATGIKDDGSGSSLLLDDRFEDGTKQHHSSHNGCTPFGQKNGFTDTSKKERLVEKRMCKCMYYYNSAKKNVMSCDSCNLKIKWKNVGNISIVDCEVPTYNVIKSVGGADLLLDGKDGCLYSAEVKPCGSTETLVRMMAEAFTIAAAGLENKVQSKPAICFFKGSAQCRDFCNPAIYNNAEFQYLLTKIAVFYITTTKPVDGIIEFTIHNNATEPLL